MLQLSQEQHNAAFIFDKPVCILAGAGSGKTRVITHRIAHLIDNSLARPYEILGVTFTNKAAKEMKERVANLIGEHAALEVNLGTFHGLAAKFLRYYGEYIGIGRNFLIYDEDDVLRLVKKIIKESYSMSKEEVTDLASEVMNIRNADKLSFRTSNKAKSVLDAYLSQIKQINALDFNQLLQSFLELLKNEDAYEKITLKAKHILVDEYQDINLIQAQIINLLAKKSKTIAIVGDDDQSIYSWRGASAKFMSDFINNFSNTQLVRLEENYRSSKAILQAANQVISNNKERLGKELISVKGDGELIRIRKHYRDNHEALMVSEQIIREFEQNSNCEIAVLMRTNALSRSLEEAFHKAKIPYRIIGGMKFYDRKEIKDILATLKACIFPNSDVDMIRLLDALPLGIGKKTIEQISTYANFHKISLFETMSNSQHLSDALDNLRAKKKIDDFVEILIKAKSFLLDPNIKTHEALMFIVEKFDFVGRLEQKNDEESQARIANIEQLIESALNFVEENQDNSIVAFLENVALISKDEVSNNSDFYSANKSVSLMTLHAAKGLEFDVVFLIGLEEGILPHSRSFINGEESLEEERRLLYVGMTRAKNKLFISYCQERFMHGKVCASIPSRFLKELPIDCIDTKDKWLLQNNTYHKNTEEKKEIIITNNFKIGDYVYHKIFLKGKILAINDGVKANAKIYFYNDNQVRTIMINFLNKC